MAVNSFKQVLHLHVDTAKDHDVAGIDKVGRTVLCSCLLEVVAGFLTRTFDHCVTFVGYSDLQKTKYAYFVLTEFPNCQGVHNDVLEGSDILVCYVGIVLPAQKLLSLPN